MLDATRWFQPSSEETPNPNDWHAYAESSADALCDEARLSYNRDEIADAVPSGGTPHAGCETVLTAGGAITLSSVVAEAAKPERVRRRKA